jgi:hypothetical protein
MGLNGWDLQDSYGISCGMGGGHVGHRTGVKDPLLAFSFSSCSTWATRGGLMGGWAGLDIPDTGTVVVL